MWTAKLITIGLIALSLAGAVASFIHAQREIGRADVRAQLAEEKAELESRLAEAAEMARQDAVQQISILRKRQATTRQALTVAENDRAAANEALARTNAAYSSWRAGALPDAVPERLHQHSIVTGTVPANRELSR